MYAYNTVKYKKQNAYKSNVVKVNDHRVTHLMLHKKKFLNFKGAINVVQKYANLIWTSSAKIFPLSISSAYILKHVQTNTEILPLLSLNN